MEYLFFGLLIFLFCLAIFDLVVGVSNDAVNFLNSAIGAKTAPFRTVMIIAAVGVFCGAAMSNGMMEIARHGIFQPEYFYFKEIMIIFLAVMVTDVILLDIFNSMGMPTSTTVSLIFELLGGTVALALIKSAASDGAIPFVDMLNTDKAFSVVLGIFISIAIAFFFGAFIQYISRLIFTFNYKRNLKWFSGVFGGIAVTSIIYFILIKGLKDTSFMTLDNKLLIEENTTLIMAGCLVFFTLFMQALHWLKVNVFKIIVLLGTFALAMAFAGNDLVNFIGVPLAGLASYQDYVANGQGLGIDGFLMDSLNGPAKTPMIFLFLAGAIMVIALITSKKAKNVIKTSLNLSKQEEGDEMFGSSSVARRLVKSSLSFSTWLLRITPTPLKKWIDSRFNKDEAILENGASFDQLRASVNLVMAALLVALGTSLKLPLSTTFVTFMVAMGTSLADRAWSRESAVFRVTGVVSVIGGWFLTAGAAFIFCFIVAIVMNYGSIPAMVILPILAIFFIIRNNIKFHKKEKQEEETEEARFQEALLSADQSEIWPLLNGYIRHNVSNELSYISNYYFKFTSSLIAEDRKNLKKLHLGLLEEKKKYKKIRRQELIGLRKADPMKSIQAGTWFHLTNNNALQLFYSLLRISEPSREHTENNFNPLPKDCIKEFLPLRDKLMSIIDKCSSFVQKNDQIRTTESVSSRSNEALMSIIREISDYKKELTITMDKHFQRINSETSSANINVYILYRSILQESQQMADTLKHLARSIEKLRMIS